MARRSALNERYQKHTAPSGKTRKSAAAAKPKRDAGTASKSKSSSRSGSALLGNPDTEEFRRLRKWWWLLIGGSLLFTAVSLGLQQWTPYESAASVLLGIGYTLIFYALYVDWFKIRKLRKEWAESQKSGGSKSSKRDTHEKES